MVHIGLYKYLVKKHVVLQLLFPPKETCANAISRENALVTLSRNTGTRWSASTVLRSHVKATHRMQNGTSAAQRKSLHKCS
jgi:hypothetical protein